MKATLTRGVTIFTLALLMFIAGSSPGTVAPASAQAASAAAEHPTGHITIHEWWAGGPYLLHTPLNWACTTPDGNGGWVSVIQVPMLLVETKVRCNPPPPAPGNFNECIQVDTYGYGVPSGHMNITAECDGPPVLSTTASFPLGGPAGWSVETGSAEFPFSCTVDVTLIPIGTFYDWWAHCEVNGPPIPL